MRAPDPRPEIQPGWDVRDIDSELVGTVIEATDRYVLVEQGRFFPDDVYIPIEAVAGVEPGAVWLNVTGQTALDEGWHTGPPVGVGFLSTESLAPGIALGGHVEELGTTEDDEVEDQSAAMAPIFRPDEIAYLESQPLGRLATVDAQGEPHVVPVTFRYNHILDTIDIGGQELARSKKYRDVVSTGRAAFVVDDLDASGRPRGIEIRGRAEVHARGGRRIHAEFDDELIRMYPLRITRWGVLPAPE